MMARKTFSMTRKFNGKVYKYHSTHNSKRTADAEARRLRNLNTNPWNARVIKRRQPKNSRKKWGYHVYKRR